MKVYIVIPTIRSLTFLQSWGGLLKGCHLVVVEDHETQGIETPKGSYKSTHHFTWGDIQRDMGEDEWIFSRRNAGIRSYGFLKAYQMGADVIVTLDDDCYPVDKNFIQQHVKNLSLFAPERWTNTFPHADFVFTRGIPYSVRNKRQVVISHGLWANQIDLDAQTQLKHTKINLPAYPSVLQFISAGSYFPMCSMNLAFRREITPLMYFPLMGTDPAGSPWGYDRFDDIWAGVFAKKIIDHLGLGVVNGSPFVEHRKASNVYSNLKKERAGIKTNESLWQQVDEVHFSCDTPVKCYLELAERVKFPKQVYFEKLREAMTIWAKLFINS